MKKIIKLSYLMVFITAGAFGDLVAEACSMGGSDFNIDWVSKQLIGVEPEAIENMSKYFKKIIKKMKQIQEEENPEPEFRLSHFKALDRLLYFCTNAVVDKNQRKISFVKGLLEVLKNNEIPDINKSSYVIHDLIYHPGGHFFEDKNVGALLDRMLVRGELSLDDLDIIVNFAKRGQRAFNAELKEFLDEGDLYEPHKQSIENFWAGLCEYLDRTEGEKLLCRSLVCAKILIRDDQQTLGEFLHRLLSIIPDRGRYFDIYIGVLLERLKLQNRVTQYELEGLAELERIGKQNLQEEPVSNPEIGHIKSFLLGIYECINPSELKKYTQNALACLDIHRPIPVMPNNMANNEDDYESAVDFVSLLEQEARDNPELVPLLNAWINLIPSDEED